MPRKRVRSGTDHTRNSEIPAGSGSPAGGEITVASLVRHRRTLGPWVGGRQMARPTPTRAAAPELSEDAVRAALDGTAPLAVLPAGRERRSSTPPTACCGRTSRSSPGPTWSSSRPDRPAVAARCCSPPRRCRPRRSRPSAARRPGQLAPARCPVSAIAGLQMHVPQRALRPAGRRSLQPGETLAAAVARAAGRPPVHVVRADPAAPLPRHRARRRCARSTPSWSAARRPTPRCSPGPGRPGWPS